MIRLKKGKRRFDDAIMFGGILESDTLKDACVDHYMKDMTEEQMDMVLKDLEFREKFNVRRYLKALKQSGIEFTVRGNVLLCRKTNVS